MIMEQRTPEWYKARLGHITSSMVYAIMATPRKKDETFTDTAKSYLYQLAAERQISPVYLNDHFEEWLERTDSTTRAMRYGTDTEQLARECYYIDLPDGYSVKEEGFVEYIPGLYGDSPDGLVCKDGIPERCIEIKCPNSATFMKYKALFAEGRPLKEVEEKYYWQCQSHMLCNNVQSCDFVVFDKMLRDPMLVINIPRHEADCNALLERVRLAGQFITNITDNGKTQTDTQN